MDLDNVTTNDEDKSSASPLKMDQDVDGNKEMTKSQSY